jgi:hypothetical protein
MMKKDLLCDLCELCGKRLFSGKSSVIALQKRADRNCPKWTLLKKGVF